MQLEHYEPGALLAQSPRTALYRARRLRDGVSVLIKTARHDYPSFRDLSQLEFEHYVLGTLDSPGVVRPLGLERDKGRLLAVLEDFGGEPLPSPRPGGFELELFFAVAHGIAHALADVHAHHVIHKDVNPRNVLMHPGTRAVKIVDFRLASELRRERFELRPTAHLESDVAYVSPEQTGRMNRDLDLRTDFYSLGIVLFELLTGTLPFAAADAIGTVHGHISKPAPDARERRSDAPEALARVIGKLLAKNPDERYQSARGLLADLSACRAGAPPRFELGSHDRSERFRVSQEIVGRESETQALLSRFEAASAGDAALVLVSGYSGIGKTSLIREIHEPVVDKRALFVTGKFEELERHVPYGALVHAVRELVDQVLAEPEARFTAFKRRLEAALGANAGVVLSLVPELEQVIGAKPPPQELSAREAQLRLQRALRDFFEAVATADHPLVIFLDDLQWADASTPELLRHLLAEERLEHVLFIGAYRENEVTEGHLLAQAIAELRAKRASALHEIRLGPLSAASVERLVGNTLRVEPERTRSLAALLVEKTAGNPFFVNELLGLLHREGALRFDADAGAWSWDDAQIARADVSDNVADLMVQRLRRLSPEVARCLKLAACLGTEFELVTLSRVAGEPPALVAAALFEAAEERLISPEDDGYRLVRDDSDYDEITLTDLRVRYRFAHDRVLSGVYSLLGEDERAAAHLRIGRLLREAAGPKRPEARVFEFVDHLNFGAALLGAPEEREDLAELNYVAARRARGAAAYAAAVAYLDAAIALLSKEEWALRRARHFECCRMQAECVFLCGQVETAAVLAEELFERAYDATTRAAAFCLQAAILEQQSRLAESVETILAGLASLGLELPQDPALLGERIGGGIAAMQAHLERVPIEGLVNLPATTDALEIAKMDLLFQLIPPASQMNPPLFILSELILFDLALTHGTTPASCKNFADCGIVFGAILSDYERAYRMGKVGLTLLDRHAPMPLEAATLFVFGCFISHWGAHFREGLEALARAHVRGVELGDTLHASYAIVHRAKGLFFAGAELAECERQTDHAAAYTLETGAVGHVAVPRILKRAIAELTGSSQDSAEPRLSDEEFVEEIKKTGNDHFLLVLGQTQTIVSMILGDVEGAARWDEFAAAYLGVNNGALPLPDLYLFRALILAGRPAPAAAEERAAALAKLEEYTGKLAEFARVSPKNFAHKLKLASAELGRFRGDATGDVLCLYQGALVAAGDDFLHLRALTNELQARFCAERGYPDLARESEIEAHYLYRRWGAAAKLERMERARARVDRSTILSANALSLEPETAAPAPEVDARSLDLSSVLKATRAISGEVQPERLYAVLMQTIIENAGAQHGYLVIEAEEGAEPSVAARASIAEPEGASVSSSPLESATDIAREVVRYVARTHKTVVIDDARADPVFRGDPRIAEGGVKSVLAVPILNQGRLLGILYAENNGVTRAFSGERLALLQVIAGQAAISIENARLYAGLERKVADRTRELSRRNREIAAMLNSLEQGVFTIDETLAVQPEYSAHLELLLGTRDVAGREATELLFAASSVSAEALRTMRVALGFSFGVPLGLAEANAAHLVREFQKQGPDGATQSFEIDWTLIADSDEIVRQVLVTLRDVTLLEELSATAARSARELDVVGQILDAGVEPFSRFCASARASLVECRRPPGEPEVEAGAARRCFRALHTVKGNARMLGLGQLADAVHAAEDLLERGELATALDRALEAVDDHERVYRKKLADLVRRDDASAERALDEIARQLAAASSGAVSAAQALSAVDRAVARARAVAFHDVVRRSSRALPAIAQALGKTAPAVRTECEPLALTASAARALGDALAQVLQNAVDHGLEPRDERARSGKPEEASIAISGRLRETGFEVRVSDDGAGLRLDALRRLGGVADAPDEAVVEVAFRPGVSTAAELSGTSGRGVGLDAVRAAIRAVGGSVRIELGAAEVAGRRPFALVFELPASAVLCEPAESLSARRSSRPPSIPAPLDRRGYVK